MYTLASIVAAVAAAVAGVVYELIVVALLGGQVLGPTQSQLVQAMEVGWLEVQGERYCYSTTLPGTESTLHSRLEDPEGPAEQATLKIEACQKRDPPKWHCQSQHITKRPPPAAGTTTPPHRAPSRRGENPPGQSSIGARWNPPVLLVTTRCSAAAPPLQHSPPCTRRHQHPPTPQLHALRGPGHH